MKNYKFYASDKLKSLLDAGDLQDHRATQTIRLVLLTRFKRSHGIENISIGEKGVDGSENIDPDFSSSGCDCCSHGLGNSVYPTIGYSKKEGVVTVGDICHECICVEYNGVEK